MNEDKISKAEQFIKENSTLFKKYKVKKKLGEGAFGDVYMGSCIENNELVAIKVEPRKILKPLLESEAFFYIHSRVMEFQKYYLLVELDIIIF